MYNQVFQPYIGDEYISQEFKVLILGESHHCGKGDNCCFITGETDQCKSFTTNVVSNLYLEYKKGNITFERWMNTFTKFSNSFEGKKLNRNETLKFWNSISFYNYVQMPMQKSRQSPTFDNFQKSLDSFKTTLEDLNPDFIIFWGKRLWNNFPKEDILEVQNEENLKLTFLNFEKKYPILVVPHPASSKLTTNHSEIIKNYIEKLKYYR